MQAFNESIVWKLSTAAQSRDPLPQYSHLWYIQISLAFEWLVFWWPLPVVHSNWCIILATSCFNTEDTHLWHVHIIHKHQQSLPWGRAVCVLSPLLDVGLQIPLDIHRGCTRREVDGQNKLQIGFVRNKSQIQYKLSMYHHYKWRSVLLWSNGDLNCKEDKWSGFQCFKFLFSFDLEYSFKRFPTLLGIRIMTN